ncbi:MAG: hypothetical protein U0746_16705 [Gemmataceae bacterium]
MVCARPGSHRRLVKETGLLGSWPNEGALKLLRTYGRGAGVGYPARRSSAASFKALRGGREEAGKEFVFCVDVATGKELGASHARPAVRTATKVPGAGHSPQLADSRWRRSVRPRRQGRPACVGLDGKVRWQKNMVKDLGGRVMAQWGWCESPLVDGDTLICCPGYEDGTVAALNKKTGDVLGRSKDLDGRRLYASTVVATIAGVRQYVVKTDKHVA